MTDTDDARLQCPPLPATVDRQVEWCAGCGLILRDCEYGLHQVAIKWSAGLCKCSAPTKGGRDPRVKS